MHAFAGAAADPAQLEVLLGSRLAGLVAEQLGELAELCAADAAALARLRDAFEGLEPVAIPDLGEEIEDLAGLARVARYLEASVNGTPPSAAQ
jgi:hypothetical protein